MAQTAIARSGTVEAQAPRVGTLSVGMECIILSDQCSQGGHWSSGVRQADRNHDTSVSQRLESTPKRAVQPRQRSIMQ